jgi:hypothetical protein
MRAKFHRASPIEEQATQPKGIIPIPFVKSVCFRHIPHGSNLLLISIYLLVCSPRKASFIQPWVRTVSPGLSASAELWH